MHYTPMTPFRRAVDAALLSHERCARRPLPPEGVDKWEVLRELTAIRRDLGLSDRTLNVLRALLSFHKDTVLGRDSASLVVFPSNAAICERLHGMPCSTMRRHLAALVTAGLIVRRDSPNGKRFVRRHGDAKIAFGFDLSPLVLRIAEFRHLAATAREAAKDRDRLRRTIILMRRDLANLITYARHETPDDFDWSRAENLVAHTSDALRRKLTIEELETLQSTVADILATALASLEPDAPETSTNDTENEHHVQNSEEDPLKKSGPPEIETCSLPLHRVLMTCTEIQTYAATRIKNWQEFIRTAQSVSGYMEIDPTIWHDATRVMGLRQAAVVISSMLEKIDEIRSPAAYLRRLSRKASAGAFSCVPMVLALERRSSQL